MRIYFSEKVTDYPKKAGDLHLAWYQNGKICISRNLKKQQMQTQNFNIIKVNQITKTLWDTLNRSFRKDLARYADQYKKTYPGLRKRGISAYSAFLMVIHALIRRFGINIEDHANAIAIFESLLDQINVYQLIQLNILKKVSHAYRLNHRNNLDVIQKYLIRKSNTVNHKRKETFVNFDTIKPCSLDTENLNSELFFHARNCEYG